MAPIIFQVSMDSDVHTDLRESRSESMESVHPKQEIRRRSVVKYPDEECTAQVCRYRRLEYHFLALELRMGRRKSWCPPVTLCCVFVRLHRRRLGCIVWLFACSSRLRNRLRWWRRPICAIVVSRRSSGLRLMRRLSNYHRTGENLSKAMLINCNDAHGSCFRLTYKHHLFPSLPSLPKRHVEDAIGKIQCAWADSDKRSIHQEECQRGKLMLWCCAM